MQALDKNMTPTEISSRGTQIDHAGDCSNRTAHGKNEYLIEVPRNELFREVWGDATSDNRQTLFGFRRFRTTHLLNLRFLEAEIDKLDHTLYQAGLELDHRPVLDRLGLKHAKRDLPKERNKLVMDQVLFERLRMLIKEYDDALTLFNTVMTMETFSLTDNALQAISRADLHAHEKFKTRMVRVDLPLRRDSRDPIQHYLRKGLRRLWFYFKRSMLRTEDEEKARKDSFPSITASWERFYQNTARVAEMFTRFSIALISGASLVAPLAILSWQKSPESRLVVVMICITIFCLLVSLLSKATNYEAMAASAAYAAVLTVFVSNGPIT